MQMLRSCLQGIRPLARLRKHYECISSLECDRPGAVVAAAAFGVAGKAGAALFEDVQFLAAVWQSRFVDGVALAPRFKLRLVGGGMVIRHAPMRFNSTRDAECYGFERRIRPEDVANGFAEAGLATTRVKSTLKIADWLTTLPHWLVASTVLVPAFAG